MSKVIFDDHGIPKPDYNLGIKYSKHGEQTGWMLIEIEKVLEKETPDLVIVFGDTNSTAAAAIAASKLHIPVVHIEAGLRSFNREMPEEINRIITDHISDKLFVPTITGMHNLLNEGLAKKSILTGDIMVDAICQNIEKAKAKSNIIESNSLNSGAYILLTLHRPYNVDNPGKLSKILSTIAQSHIPVVFPVHPRTRKIITANNIPVGNGVKMIDPVGYLDFINLQSNAERIVTDSGGIQKEAYILKKPCITIRPETEWIETVIDGWNVLAQPEDIDFGEKIFDFRPKGQQTNVFGENVADIMVDELLRL